MSEVLRYHTASGHSVLVEVPLADQGGFENSSFKSRIVDATATFESAVAEVVDAAESALGVIADGALRPDTIAMTFGVRFSSELGAVLAKASAEANLSITLTWGKDHDAAGDVPEAPILQAG